MKLLGSTKSKITKDEKGEHVPHLEIIEGVLVHYTIFNSDYRHNSRALCTFILNKFLVNLAKNFIFLRTFNSEFFYIEVWITDQNSEPLDGEDKIDITLVIN